ncbi:MAG: DUF2079 domain-containing protein [Actinomycetota bacterium]
MTIAISLAAIILYAWVGLARYSSGRSGNYDLGIFTQAAQGWVNGKGPYSEIKGITLFGDHFSPITVLFGAGYALWPDPRSLIVLQAITLGVAVAILSGYAWSSLRPREAAFVSFVAVASSPFMGAAAFDVHETGLGAPLVAWLALSLIHRKFAQAIAASCACLCIKEDLGLMVIMAGLAWYTMHRHHTQRPVARQALTISGLGFAGFTIANAVIILQNPSNTSPYLHLLFGDTNTTTSGPFITRVVPILLVVGLSGLAIKQPILLLAIPTLAWRVASSNPGYWSYKFHYDAILLPLCIVALTHALKSRPLAEPGSIKNSRVVFFSAHQAQRTVVLTAAVLAMIPGLVRFTNAAPWRTDITTVSVDQRTASRFVAHLPRGSLLLTSERLGPHLIQQHRVKLLDSGHPTPARWALVDLKPSTMEIHAHAQELYWRSLSDPHASVRREGNVAFIAFHRNRPLP